MKFLISPFLSIFFVLTANAQFGVKAKKIDEIFLKMDKEQNLNKGTTFNYTICARMKNGKIKELNSGVQVSGDGLERRGKNKMLISKSNDCSKEIYLIDYSFTKRDYYFEGSDSIQLNFKGKIISDFSGGNGGSGQQADKRNVFDQTLRNRDGKKGEDGKDGNNGESAPYLKTFIRKDTLSNLILIDVFNLDNNLLYCYKTTSLSYGITYIVNGGNGGNGGKGNSGQNGRGEKEKSNGKIKRSGEGGNGGQGGIAGNGGHGGVVEVYLHESLKNEKSYISVKNEGGTAGIAGKGGAGGIAGKNIDGSTLQNNGNAGLSGELGTKGVRGGIEEIIIVSDIDFKLF